MRGGARHHGRRKNLRGSVSGHVSSPLLSSNVAIATVRWVCSNFGSISCGMSQAAPAPRYRRPPRAMGARLGLFMTPQLRANLEQAAVARGTSISALARQVLEAGLQSAGADAASSGAR